MAGECFGKAWGMGDLGNAWECSKEARGRLGGLGGFGECSQDALRSLGGAYELVPSKLLGCKLQAYWAVKTWCSCVTLSVAYFVHV